MHRFSKHSGGNLGTGSAMQRHIQPHGRAKDSIERDTFNRWSLGITVKWRVNVSTHMPADYHLFIRK